MEANFKPIGAFNIIILFTLPNTFIPSYGIEASLSYRGDMLHKTAPQSAAMKCNTYTVVALPDALSTVYEKAVFMDTNIFSREGQNTNPMPDCLV